MYPPSKHALFASEKPFQCAAIWYTPQTPWGRKFYIDKKLNYCGKRCKKTQTIDYIFFGSLPVTNCGFFKLSSQAFMSLLHCISGVVHQSNMASKSALAPKLYKRFLQVCEQWPVDQNRLGRDLGEHLNRNLVPRIKKAQIDVSWRFSSLILH